MMNLKTSIKLRLLSICFSIVFVADAISKAIAVFVLKPAEAIGIIPGYIELYLIQNVTGYSATSKYVENLPLLHRLWTDFWTTILMMLVTFFLITRTKVYLEKYKIWIFFTILILPAFCASFLPGISGFTPLPIFLRMPAVILFSWALWLTRNKYLFICFSLCLSAGLSNMISQIVTDGGVVDFILFPFAKHFLGVSNIADIMAWTGFLGIALFPIVRFSGRAKQTL